MALLASAAFALTPETLTITNLMREAEVAASSATYYQGASLTLTDCVAYAGTSTSASRQNLTACTVTVRLGDAGYSAVFTGLVTTATSGTWSATLTVPTNRLAECYLQPTFTDGTNTIIYPWKTIDVRAPLQ